MKTHLLFLALLISKLSSAQDMLGVANGNYAGNSGMAMNPTSMVLMPYKWEVSILSLNLSLENNYIGLPKKKITNPEYGANQNLGGLNEYYTPGNKSANMHLGLGLPAFIYRFQDMAVGFHMTIRNDFSAHNLPADILKMMTSGNKYAPIQGKSIPIEGMRLGDLTWLETGISFGKQLSRSETRKWLAAGTFKYITAFQGSYFGISKGVFKAPTDSSLNLSNIKGTLDYSYVDNLADALKFRCSGVGFDFGLTYISNPFTQKYSEGRPIAMKKYDYRLGVSLIDLGFVNFGKNAHALDFNTAAVKFDNTSTLQTNSSKNIDSLVYASAMNGQAIGNHFMMSLPTALSAQYDVCVKPRWYFNLTAIQRVPMPMARVDRPNMIAATIRYETPFLEIGFPYSFYDYYRHRIGMAVRYHFIYIGTDKIGTFVGGKDITGVDFYFGIKLSQFEFIKKAKSGRHVGCAAYY